MTTSRTSNSEWEEWSRLALNAVRSHANGAVDSAFAVLNDFLLKKHNPEIQSDALGYRADFHEQRGDFEAASQDLIKARTLISACYARYVHELKLGDIYRKLGKDEESLYWYKIALKTSVVGPGISGGSALKAIASSTDISKLPNEDFALYAKAVRCSWHVLKLAGEPDLDKVTSTIAQIKRAEAAPRRE